MMNMSVQSFSIHTPHSSILPFFFFNDTATTEIYTLSLHDALPISPFPISILRNCLTRKSAAAPPESTTSRKQKHPSRSEEHTSELQSRLHLVCRLLLEKKKKKEKLGIETYVAVI